MARGFTRDLIVYTVLPSFVEENKLGIEGSRLSRRPVTRATSVTNNFEHIYSLISDFYFSIAMEPLFYRHYEPPAYEKQVDKSIKFCGDGCPKKWPWNWGSSVLRFQD